MKVRIISNGIEFALQRWTLLGWRDVNAMGITTGLFPFLNSVGTYVALYSTRTKAVEAAYRIWGLSAYIAPTPWRAV